jgi:uncharacterized phage protein gp47/JayE
MSSTVTSTVTYIPQIDYTSRDYVSIVNDLTTIAQQFNPTWSASDPTDIGVTLIELFAYLGDLLNYYADRSASEGFLATASQRQSILQLAAMFGYTVTTNQPAVATITLANTSGSSVTVPALTQLKSTQVVNGQNTDVTFELDADTTISANSSVTTTATQGITYSNVTLGTSTGAPNQVFKINAIGVIVNGVGATASLKVYVGTTQYTYVSSLIDSASYDSTFTTSIDADGYTYIIFGDGVAGRIPPASLTVSATYRLGVGSQGNVPAGTILSLATNNVSNVTVTQPSAATGGADIESSDSIRVNAPRALRTLRRAVSLKDYAYMALQVAGVAKAIADSSVWTTVNLYIGPYSTAATSTYGPYTGVTAIAATASDSTTGSGYLTYTCANSGLAVGQYVTVTGMAPVNYNIYTPALITYADTTKFTVAGSIAGTFNQSLSATAQVTSTGSNSSDFNTLASTVLTYFTDKVAPNVTLNVLPPTYVQLNLDMTVQVLKQYQQSAVLAQVNNVLSNLFDYTNAFFADKVPQQYILQALSNIDGVDITTKVTHLRKNKDEKIFSVASWTATTSAVTLTTTAAHTITVGSTIRVYNVDPTIDGSYTVTSVGSTTVTFNLTGTATPTGITASAWTTASTQLTGLSSVAGITVGMNVTGTNLVSTVKSVGTTTIDLVTKPTGSGSGALTFTKPYTAADNYVKVVAVDDIVCATNEIPIQGIFNITAVGGLS